LSPNSQLAKPSQLCRSSRLRLELRSGTMISSTALRGQTTSVSSVHSKVFISANKYAGLKATFCSCFVYGKLAHRMRDPTLTDYNRFNVDVRPAFFPILGSTNTLPVLDLPILRHWICVSFTTDFPSNFPACRC
jgi:hypothetical protein